MNGREQNRVPREAAWRLTGSAAAFAAFLNLLLTRTNQEHISNGSHVQPALPPRTSPMPGITDDPPASPCYHLIFGSRIGEYQQVGPDIFLHLQARARGVGAAARGRRAQ